MGMLTKCTKPSMQESKKNSLNAIFHIIPKMLHIKSPNVMTNQTYPIAPILQRQSKHIQTHVHFNNFPGDFVIPDTFVFPKLMFPLHKK